MLVYPLLKACHSCVRDSWSHALGILTLLRSGCAKILRIGIGIEKVVSKVTVMEVLRFGDEEALIFKVGYSKCVVVVEENAKKEEEKPAVYSPIRELKEGIEQRDVDKWQMVL